MKTKFSQLALPLGLGVILFAITTIGLLSVSCDGLTEAKDNCTNEAYPLWCKSVKVCCTPGHAYYCDGQCYASGCPTGTVSRDICKPE